ncbi:WD repeat-containing protein 6-like [Acipenser ruthenus]|uniref:WD repeat-containing protein 6-like n=1 Tax=Acipenser ruthenus TaxID=7906 RepID=UPI0027410AF0|nr:WD repeat-containing protein 6-like [Acipenser ruthenus]
MESVLLRCPVTALEFLGEDCLLSGEGPVLTVYSLGPHRESASRSVLRNYRIHGIRPSPWRQEGGGGAVLAVFGGKAVRVMELREGPSIADLSPLSELQDWVWDVCWLQDGEGSGSGMLAVALAHNAVVLLDPVSGRALREVHCEETCILYSALLVGRSWARLALVSGTVFNQLVLWRPGNWGPRNEEGQARAECRVAGHQGVIFGLAYQPHRGLLASASDDRSVRLWEVGDLSEEGGVWGSGGAGGPCCLQILYGHQARVWAVRLLSDWLLSVGEDSACLLWGCRRGNVLRRFKGHRGRGVRALAAIEREGGGAWVATGGADSGIRLWRIGGERAEGEVEIDEGEGMVRAEGEVEIDEGEGMVRAEGEVEIDEGEGVVKAEGEVEIDEGEGVVRAEGEVEIDEGEGMVRAEGEVEIDEGEGVVKAEGEVEIDEGEGVVEIDEGEGVVRAEGEVMVRAEGEVEIDEGEGVVKAEGEVEIDEGEGVVRAEGEVEIDEGEGMVRAEGEVEIDEGEGVVRAEGEVEIDEGEETEGESSPGGRRLSQLLFSGQGTPKVIRLVDSGAQVLVMTDSGCLYCHSVGEEVLQCGGGECWGCAVSLSQPGGAVEVWAGRGKVHSLCWGSREAGSELFVSGPEGRVQWWGAGQAEGTPLRLLQRGSFLLPPCRHRWLTGVAFLPGSGDGAGLWVCGDRRGSVLLYRNRASRGEQGEGVRTKADPQEPVSVLFGLHGRQGVTSVTVQGGLVYSTGRDGCYRALRVREGGPVLEVLRAQRACRGMGWIERVLFQGVGGGGELVLGFHSTDLVLWDSGRKERLLCVPCGGGHRSWSYSRGSAGFSFAFLKQGAVCLSRAPRRYAARCCSPVVRQGLHGREVTCLCRLGAVATPGGAVDILVTGSEDTTLTVLAVQPSHRRITALTTLTDHISSVRALATAQRGGLTHGHTDQLSALLFSAGGRAQLQCYRLLIGWDKQRQGVSCQAIHLASHRLDEHWERMRNRHKTVKMDPETRYMSVAVVDAGMDGGDAVFLAAACSDGAVRLFSLWEERRRLALLAEWFHHQRCVLKVTSFTHWLGQQQESRRVFLCSAATDGSIAFWDITEAVEGGSLEEDGGAPQRKGLGSPFLTVQLHQSGVNSLDILETETPGRYLLASGGDDGSLQVCRVCVESSVAVASVRISARFAVLSAHAALLTGLRFLTPDLLVSASVDQRVALWRLGRAGLSWQGARFCHVADVAGLEAWQREEDRDTFLAVCGQGLQILRLGHRERLGETGRDWERLGEGAGGHCEEA